MSITKKLLITLAICIISLLTVGAYGIFQLNNAQQRFDYVATNTLPSIGTMDKAYRATAEMRVALLKTLMLDNAQERSVAMQAMLEADKKYDEALSEYAKNDISNEEDQRLLDEDRAAMAKYREIREKSLSIYASGQKEQAIKYLFGDGYSAAKALSKSIDSHVEFNVKFADTLVDNNKNSYQLALLVLGIVIATAFAISVIMGGMLFKVITSGLSNIQNAIGYVNNSLDFTHRVPVKQMDEIGHTATDFNNLLNGMQRNLGKILLGAQQVAQASEAMHQTASQVSSASSAQSEASSNMAATVEQMTVSITHVADRAQETLKLTQEAGKLVQGGSDIIEATIKDIREISSVISISGQQIRELETSSAQVSNIVNVIREIAEQTNLLALNAAIEAARAGEQGRGFAVVADEVRKLAERTTRSTEEVSQTIDSMVERAKSAATQMQTAEELVVVGVTRADEADQAVKRIGTTSAESNTMVSEISAAISQQSVASNNIAAEVERTAQMAEESSAAAHHTADTARHLDDLVKEQIATLSLYKL